MISDFESLVTRFGHIQERYEETPSHDGESPTRDANEIVAEACKRLDEYKHMGKASSSHKVIEGKP
jgi:hypothetical protein